MKTCKLPRSSAANVPAAATPAATSESVVPAAMSGVWASEPTTADDLVKRYDTIMECPSRNSNVQIKLVSAMEKGEAEAKLISSGQQHKIFLAMG